MLVGLMMSASITVVSDISEFKAILPYTYTSTLGHVVSVSGISNATAELAQNCFESLTTSYKERARCTQAF